MSRHILEKIRLAILNGNYDLTSHAIDEMVEDFLSIYDIESAIFTGQMTKIETDDPRGIRYTVIGYAKDRKTEVGVVGCFPEQNVYLIITVYAVT